MAGQPLVLRTLQPGELERRAAEIGDIFNEAWERNWGHVPLSPRQFRYFIQELKPLLRPELVNLVLDGERVVAFGIAIPDINPLIQQLNGRWSLLDRLRLLYAARFGPLRQVRALVLGVRQPYQGRRLHYAIILRTYLYLARETPCEVCDLSLVPENLWPWVKTIESFGGRPYKTFRVLEREI